MREFASVGPDVRLHIGLLEGLVGTFREWTCVHEGVIVFIVRTHMSRKICLAAYSFVTDVAVNNSCVVSCSRHLVIVCNWREAVIYDLRSRIESLEWVKSACVVVFPHILRASLKD